MTNESPYEALGRKQDTNRVRSAIIRTYGEESLYGLAARGLGEWRDWRDLAEQNELADPFNVTDRQAENDSPIAVVFDFPVSDSTTGETCEIDIGARNPGPQPTLFVQGPTAPSEVILWVTERDVSGAQVFDYQLESDSGELGPATRITRDDFNNVLGDATEIVIAVRASDGGALVMTLNIDTHFVFWFASKTPLRPASSRASDGLVLPPLALPTGRGE